MQTATKPDTLVIAGAELRSRLFVGTGKYSDDATMVAALEASGCELVTVALRRLDLDNPKKKTILDVIDWRRFRILPNTAGCRTADEAIRIARLARSMGLSDWVKLEVIPDPRYLLPDPEETLKAARVLVAEGFQVPLWVVFLSAATIAFGTYAGGWRIIRTLGWNILKLDPATGMSAQLTGATVIQVATLVGLPVSTTHVVTGSVMGVGASRKLSAVRWGVGANIIAAWIVTIPCAAIIAWVTLAILSTAGLHG